MDNNLCGPVIIKHGVGLFCPPLLNTC